MVLNFARASKALIEPDLVVSVLNSLEQLKLCYGGPVDEEYEDDEEYDDDEELL